jgi:hypothetical protein
MYSVPMNAAVHRDLGDLAHWTKVLKKFIAADKKPAENVGHLQSAHRVPRCWARTLKTRFMKTREATRM